MMMMMMMMMMTMMTTVMMEDDNDDDNDDSGMTMLLFVCFNECFVVILEIFCDSSGAVDVNSHDVKCNNYIPNVSYEDGIINLNACW